MDINETHTKTVNGGNSGRASLGGSRGDHKTSYLADKMRSLNITRTIRSSPKDGYEEDKKRSTITGGVATPDARSSTTNGRRAVEQNFILSTLKGVANALKSSHRNSLKQSLGSSSTHGRRPTSAISSASTPPASSSSSSSSTTSTPHSTIGRRRKTNRTDLTTALEGGRHLNRHDRDDDDDTDEQQSLCSINITPKQQSSFCRIRNCSQQYAHTHHNHLQRHHRHSTPIRGVDLELTSNCSTSSSVSSNLSSSNTIDCYGDTGGGVNSSSSSNNFNVTISSNHLSLLESMKFDQASDIESIKKDLIKICRENRLEILAHYVSQIG